LFDLNYLVTLN